MLDWKVFRSRWLAVTWFVLMCVLFFLPGSAFPRENFLSRFHIDKLVHAGLFGVLVFLFRSSFDLRMRHYGYLLLALTIIYGFMVELIQRQWVPNRDFDLYDVVADAAGSLAGLLIWARAASKSWAYKKNKPL